MPDPTADDPLVLYHLRPADALEPRCDLTRMGCRWGFRRSSSGRGPVQGRPARSSGKINPTRVPIEQKESIRWLESLRQSVALFGAPERCIHIGDRENDIYELFCTAQEL